MTTVIAAVALVALIPTLALVIYALGQIQRVDNRVRGMRVEIARAREYVDRKIAEEYLTAEDRQLLGLPQIEDFTERREKAIQGYADAEAELREKVAELESQIETARRASRWYQQERRQLAKAEPKLACEKHRWGPMKLEKPRRPRELPQIGNDGMAYVRTCVDCEHRQVKLWSFASAADRWFDD